jgi:hypothetical protein
MYEKTIAVRKNLLDDGNNAGLRALLYNRCQGGERRRIWGGIRGQKQSSMCEEAPYWSKPSLSAFLQEISWVFTPKETLSLLFWSSSWCRARETPLVASLDQPEKEISRATTSVAHVRGAMLSGPPPIIGPHPSGPVKTIAEKYRYSTMLSISNITN